jgi:hypothetical protein
VGRAEARRVCDDDDGLAGDGGAQVLRRDDARLGDRARPGGGAPEQLVEERLAAGERSGLDDERPGQWNV